MNNKIPVTEIFGPTIQGEGMVIGRKTMFVRTAGCDYSCTWCDSSFTWDGTGKDEIKQMTAQEIFLKLKEIGGDRFDHVTISGGNPALYAALTELVELLHDNHMKVGLETQGSRWQDWLLKVDDLTISPKPPSSNMETDFEKLDFIINELTKHNRIQKNTSLKVVIFNDEDLLYAKKVHARYIDVPFYLQVGNKDIQTVDDHQLLRSVLHDYETLIDKVMNASDFNNVRILPQLHTLLWGNKRGV